MRSLQEIDNDLAEAREELSNVKGTNAEVYSRIVGYYRSVRNWNKGKREEYGERKLYDVGASLACAPERFKADEGTARLEEGVKEGLATEVGGAEAEKLLLFVRNTCPQCPSAKNEAAKLGIPVEMVNADSESGLEEAARLNVMSTPTAILFSKDGSELERARDSSAIAGLSRYIYKAA